jgi:myo-inositol-1-phosphate synthase
METAEIKNGRLAMIAITAFAAQEFATGVSVVNETPFLF